MTELNMCKKRNGWESSHFYFGKLEKEKKGEDPWAAMSFLNGIFPCREIETAKKAQQKINEEEQR